MSSLRGGKLTYIRVDGTYGLFFIPKSNCIKIGSSIHCDVRIKNELIKKTHCLIYYDAVSNLIKIKNFSKKNPVILNSSPMTKKIQILQNRDTVKIVHREFLWTYSLSRKSRKSLTPGRNSLATVNVQQDTTEDCNHEQEQNVQEFDGNPLEYVKLSQQDKKVGRRVTCKINRIPIGNIGKRLKAQKRITIHEFHHGDKISNDHMDTEEQEDQDEPLNETVTIIENEEKLLGTTDTENEKNSVTCSSIKSTKLAATPLKDITKMQEQNIMTTPKSLNMFPLEASTPFQGFAAVNKNLSMVKLSQLEKSDSLVWSYSPSTLSHRAKSVAKSFTAASNNSKHILAELIDLNTPENTVIRKTVSSSVYLIDLTTPDTSNLNTSAQQRTPNKSVVKSSTLLKSAIKNSTISKTPKSVLHGTANLTIKKDRPLLGSCSAKKVLNMSSNVLAEKRKSLFLNKSMTHTPARNVSCLSMLREACKTPNLNVSKVNKRKTMNDFSLKYQNDQQPPIDHDVDDFNETPKNEKSGFLLDKDAIHGTSMARTTPKIIVTDTTLDEDSFLTAVDDASVVTKTPGSQFRKSMTAGSVSSGVKTPVVQIQKSMVYESIGVTPTKTPMKSVTTTHGRALEEIVKLVDTPNEADLPDATSGQDTTNTPGKDVSSNDLQSIEGVTELMNTSVKNDLTNIPSIKDMFKTPGKHVPTNDLTDVTGVKELMNTPAKDDLTDVGGLKQLMLTPGKLIPANDLTNIVGVKELMNTPVINDLTDVRGVKELMKTPGRGTIPKNDLTDIRGVKELLNTPVRDDLRDVHGVKELFNTPLEGHNPDFTVNFDTFTSIINSPCNYESGSKNVSICTLPSIEIAPDDTMVFELEGEDEVDESEFNEDFVSKNTSVEEIKTMDQTFDELAGKNSISKTYARKKSTSPDKRPGLTHLQSENIEKWLVNVNVGMEIQPKPNNNQQILSNRYSNVTPQTSVMEPSKDHEEGVDDGDESVNESSNNSEDEFLFEKSIVHDNVDQDVSMRMDNYDDDLTSVAESDKESTVQELSETDIATQIIPETQQEEQLDSNIAIENLDDNSKDTYIIEDYIIPETQVEVFQGDDSNDCGLDMSSQELETNISMVLNGEEEIMGALIDDNDSRDTYIVEPQMPNVEVETIAGAKNDSSILFIDDTICETGMEENLKTVLPIKQKFESDMEIMSSQQSSDSSIIFCLDNVEAATLHRTRSKSQTPQKVDRQSAKKSTRKTMNDALNGQTAIVSVLHEIVEEFAIDKDSETVEPGAVQQTTSVSSIQTTSEKEIEILSSNESSIILCLDEPESGKLRQTRSKSMTPQKVNRKTPKKITRKTLGDTLNIKMEILAKDQQDFEEDATDKLSETVEDLENPQNISENKRPHKSPSKSPNIKNQSCPVINLSDSLNDSKRESIDSDETSLDEKSADENYHKPESEISGVEPLQKDDTVDNPEASSCILLYEDSEDEMISGVFDNMEKETLNGSMVQIITDPQEISQNKSQSQSMLEEYLENDSKIFQNFDENKIVRETRGVSQSPVKLKKSDSLKTSRKTLGDHLDKKKDVQSKFEVEVKNISLSVNDIADVPKINRRRALSVDLSTKSSPEKAQNKTIAEIHIDEYSEMESAFENFCENDVFCQTRGASVSPLKETKISRSTRKTMGDQLNKNTPKISKFENEIKNISAKIEYLDPVPKLVRSRGRSIGPASLLPQTKSKLHNKTISQIHFEEELESGEFENFDENAMVRVTRAASQSPVKMSKDLNSKTSRNTMGDKLNKYSVYNSKFETEVNDITLSMVENIGDGPKVPRTRSRSIDHKPKSNREVHNRTISEIYFEKDVEMESESFENFDENHVNRERRGASESPVKELKSILKPNRKTLGDRLDKKSPIKSNYEKEIHNLNVSIDNVDDIPKVSRSRGKSMGFIHKSISSDVQNKTISEIQFEESVENELDSKEFENFNENEIVRETRGTSQSPVKQPKSSTKSLSRKTMGDQLDKNIRSHSKFESEINDISLSVGDVGTLPNSLRRLRGRSIDHKPCEPKIKEHNKTISEIHFEEEPNTSDQDSEVFENFVENPTARTDRASSQSPVKKLKSDISKPSRKTMGDQINKIVPIESRFESEVKDLSINVENIEPMPNIKLARAKSMSPSQATTRELAIQNKTISEINVENPVVELNSDVFENFDENHINRATRGTSASPVKLSKINSKSSRKTVGDKLQNNGPIASNFEVEVNNITMSVEMIDSLPKVARLHGKSLDNHPSKLIPVATNVNKTISDIAISGDANLDDTFEHDESEDLFDKLDANEDESSAIIIPETQEIPVDLQPLKDLSAIVVIPETQAFPIDISDEYIIVSESIKSPAKLSIINHDGTVQNPEIPDFQLSDAKLLSPTKISVSYSEATVKNVEKELSQESVASSSPSLKSINRSSGLHKLSLKSPVQTKPSSVAADLIPQVVIENIEDKMDVVEVMPVLSTPAPRKRRLYSRELYTPTFEDKCEALADLAHPTSTPHALFRTNMDTLNISKISPCSSRSSSTEGKLLKGVLIESIESLLDDKNLNVVEEPTSRRRRGAPKEEKKVEELLVEIEPKSSKSRSTSRKRGAVLDENDIQINQLTENEIIVDSSEAEPVGEIIDTQTTKAKRRVIFAEKVDEKIFELEESLKELPVVRGRRATARGKAGNGKNKLKAEIPVAGAEENPEKTVVEKVKRRGTDDPSSESTTKRSRSRRIVNSTGNHEEISHSENVDATETEHFEKMNDELIEPAMEFANELDKGQVAPSKQTNVKTIEISLEKEVSSSAVALEIQNDVPFKESAKDVVKKDSSRTKSRRAPVKTKKDDKTVDAEKKNEAEIHDEDPELQHDEITQKKQLTRSRRAPVKQSNVEPRVENEVEAFTTNNGKIENEDGKIDKTETSKQDKSRRAATTQINSEPVAENREVTEDKIETGSEETENAEFTTDNEEEHKKINPKKGRAATSNKKNESKGISLKEPVLVKQTVENNESSETALDLLKESVESKTLARGRPRRAAPTNKKNEESESTVNEQEHTKGTIASKKPIGRGKSRRAADNTTNTLEKMDDVNRDDNLVSTSATEETENSDANSKDDSVKHEKTSSRVRGRRAPANKKNVAVSTTSNSTTDTENLQKTVIAVDVTVNSVKSPEKTQSDDIVAEKKVEDHVSPPRKGRVAHLAREVFVTPTEPVRRRGRLPPKKYADVTDSESEQVHESPVIERKGRAVKKTKADDSNHETPVKGRGRRAAVQKPIEKAVEILSDEKVEETNVSDVLPKDVFATPTEPSRRRGRPPTKKAADLTDSESEKIHESPSIDRKRRAVNKEDEEKNDTPVKASGRRAVQKQIKTSEGKPTEEKVEEQNNSATLAKTVNASPTEPARRRGRQPAKKRIDLADSESEQVQASAALDKRQRAVKKAKVDEESSISEIEHNEMHNEAVEKPQSRGARGRKQKINTELARVETPVKTRGRQPRAPKKTDLDNEKVEEQSVADAIEHEDEKSRENSPIKSQKSSPVQVKKALGRRAAVVAALHQDDKSSVPAKRVRKAKVVDVDATVELEDTNEPDSSSHNSTTESVNVPPSPVSATKSRSRKNVVRPIAEDANVSVEKKPTNSRQKRKVTKNVEPSPSVSTVSPAPPVKRSTRTRAK